MTALGHVDRLLGPGERALTAEQEAAVARREGPLLLAAGAGSGKTSVLVERFARMVAEDGLAAGRILAITFTEKAAGELRARVRARLLRLELRDAAREAEAAWISTIHGFCARLLRANAVAAGVDPEFSVLDEAAARALARQAFDAALARWLGGGADPVRAARLDLAAAYTPDRLHGAVAAVHEELRSRGETRPTLPRPARPDVGAALQVLRAAAALALGDLAGARDLAAVDAARAALGACAGALDALAAGARVPVPVADGWSFTAGNVAELQRPAAQAHLEACRAYRQACVDAEAADAVALLDDLLGAYAAAYAAAKRARSAVDFADLELLTRDLLREQPAVARAVSARFERVMVDEFQDTNPLQLELLELLGVDHVFVVGDELQSIYGFRHADVEVFRRRRAELEAAGHALTLATSFRAHPELLATLDAAFGAGHGPGYVPLVAGRDDPPASEPLVELLVTDAAAWDAGRNGAPAEDGPPAELLEAVGAGLDADRPSLAAEARLVAQRVRDLVDEGACHARDVVVLVRALRAMPPLERALQDAGLATLAGGGRGWWGRRQVADLLAWLGALANPRDEEALLGVLASPLGGASSDALALLALARPAGAALWDVLAEAYLGADREGLRARMHPADDACLAAVAARLAAERAGAARHGLDELLERAVRLARYDRHVLALPGGVRRLANVRKLQRLAAAFEAREGRDVRGFVDLALAELEAEAVETDAPVDLGDRDAVRLMTMHAAKGLEFPVVVCAGLGRAGATGMPAVLVDGPRIGLRLATLDGRSEHALDYEALRERRREAEIAEERRILHVAMTRAEERLVLSGAAPLGDRWPREGHGCPPVSWIGPALLPGVATALTPEEPEQVAAVGSGDGRVRVLLNAPATVGRVLRAGGPPPPAEPARLVEAPPVAPAEPVQLALDLAAAAAPAVAVPPTAPAPPPVPSVSYSSLGAYAACGYRFYQQRVLRLPEVPAPAHLRPETGGAPEARLRGSIVHALLERADLRPGAPPPSDDDVRAVAADHEATLRDEDVADVRRLLDAFAASGVRERLAAATGVRREHPFALPLGPGGDGAPLLTGVVDVLATERDGSALVVDYKTDRVEDEDLAALVARDYALQRAAYALAALRAGAPAAEIVHLYLERPADPVAARFEREDADALQARLAASAAPLLAGDFPVAAHPHAGLCATCPGRGGLCSWPVEATDRPAP